MHREETTLTSKVSYLGPKGTFTKLAVDTAFNGVDTESFKTIPECIDAVEQDKIDIGVVPLENAIEGTVQLTIDYLVHQVRLPVFGELVVPIQQHLLARPDYSGDLSDIEEVHSHSHAIAQCHQYLHQNMPNAEIHFTDSTARAAELISEKQQGNIVAIGNSLAASEYELHIFKRSIHDYANNHTRFAVLSKNESLVNIDLPIKQEKTTLLITLPSDKPGALHQVLSAFAWRRMNLSKIESRPMKTGLGNYFFIIDVVQPMDDVLYPGVQGELEALGCEVTILGSYPGYEIEL